MSDRPGSVVGLYATIPWGEHCGILRARYDAGSILPIAGDRPGVVCMFGGPAARVVRGSPGHDGYRLELAAHLSRPASAALVAEVDMGYPAFLIPTVNRGRLVALEVTPIETWETAQLRRSLLPPTPPGALPPGMMPPRPRFSPGVEALINGGFK